MLTYSFTNIKTDSLYEHLYKCLKNDILNQVLPPQYKLPSKRSFAKNLGISTITIENAYAQLIAEGYIYSIPKKGYYVSDVMHTLQFPISQIKKHQTKADSVFTNADSTEYFADFTSNRTGSSQFPFYTWTKLMKQVNADYQSELMTPSPSGGILPLREAIATYLSEFRGMNVTAEQIIIGAGTEYLYSLLINLLGRDKIFAVEDPGYQKIRQVYEANNVQCRNIPIDEEGLHIQALNNSSADILHISPSHHYPTGIVTSVSRRYELLNWAIHTPDRYIIEDDYDSEFRLQGKPIPTLQSMDISDRVIYMNTFSKSLTSTIRISYMVLPKPLLATFYQKLNFYACTVSNFEQYTLYRFITEGYFEKHINRMRIFYKKQRDLLLQEIKSSPLSNRISIQEKDAGLHFLMQIHTTCPDSELIKRAKENQVKINCLSEFFYNQKLAIQHTIIINYSAIEPKQIPEAVKRLLSGVFHCS